MKTAFRAALAAACPLLLGSVAHALQPATPGSLAPLERALARVVPAVDEAAQERLRAGSPGVAALALEAGGPWQVDFDLSYGGLRRALGAGIPLLGGDFSEGVAPGQEPSLAVREQAARAFLARHPDLFPIDPAEWAVDPTASQPLDGGRVLPILFRRTVGGVPVVPSQIQLVVNRGKLTYINATRMEPIVESPNPALDEAASWAAFEAEATRAGVSLQGAVPEGKGALVFVPRQVVPGGPVTHRLARRHDFALPGGIEHYRATLDANTGELLALEDLNRYATCSLDATKVQGQVRGGVRPAQATDTEVTRNFLYPRVTEGTTVKNGDSGGYYFYGGGNATSRMGGTFFNVSCRDGCSGQPLVSNATTGILDFGVGGSDEVWNGLSTPADRTALYHENVARAIAAKWRSVPWLDDNVRINTNIDAVCNAFWNGTSLNFFRSGCTPRGTCCTNTGEIRDVMQHEWGHGLDGNDGGGFSADGGTGEGYADHIALFVDHDSCVGQSFFAAGSGDTGPYCISIPACASTAPCTGVRNIDEKKSTSGLMTVTTASPVCGGPTTGCVGPLRLECHCEGEIFGQADFHLINNLLTGRAYDTGAALAGTNPAYPDTAGWYILEHIFFNANELFVSYAPSSIQSDGTGAYDAFIAVDDDNASLADGTPNAAYINQAYQHHGINETPLVTDSANCVAPTDPVVTVTALTDPTSGNAQVKVTWPDTTASFYVVYRSLKLTDVWLEVRKVTDTGGPYEVYDDPVQIGETYNYTVVAVSSKGCPSAGASIKTIVVGLPDAAAVVVPAGITDPAPGGDGDGIPEPGEKVRIRVDLKEIGGLVGITNPSVSIASFDPLARVTVAGPISYGASVAAGATVLGPSTFEVAISAAHGCGTLVPLIALVAADNACESRAFVLSIPTTSCVKAARGEVNPTAITITGDGGTASCTDGDLFPDNGETVAVSVAVRNVGGAGATSVSATLVSSNPKVVITGSPASLGALAAGASTNANFTLVTTDATCLEPVTLTASANSTENLFPVLQSLDLYLEKNLVPATFNTGFETDFGGWTAVGFVRSTRRARTGTRAAFGGPAPAGHACDTSGTGANACMTLTSPAFMPSDTSSFTMATWYSLEGMSPGCATCPDQYWDRANVHVVDALGDHYQIAPTSGRAYQDSAGDGSDNCHIDSEAAWAGNTDGTSWATSTFDLSPYANQTIQLEINYNSDDSAICEGIYVDDLSVTDTVVCDTLSCGSGTCPTTPAKVRLLRAVKRVADAVFSWTAEPTAGGGYKVYDGSPKTVIPTLSRVGGGGSLVGTAPVAVTTLTHTGIVTDRTKPMLYYQAVAVCADGLTEGPN